jgi:uncharacterized protein DUF3352
VASTKTRLKLRLALGGAAVVLVLALALSGGGAAEQAPATGAAAIVPGDALAYIHVSIDRGRPAVKRALALAQRFPDYQLFSAAVVTRLGAIAGGAANVDFARDVRPWLGKEVALALLNTPTTTAGSVIVLDVGDGRRATAFVTRNGASAAPAYRGTKLYRYPGGTELAFVSHYLVVGQDAGVRAAIDVAAGATASLQANPGYRRAAGGEPPDRVIDAYASAAGVRRLLAAQGGLVGALGVLLYQPALTAVTISLSAVSGGARLLVHSALDPSLVHLGGSAGLFSPSLQSVIPAGSMLMLDVTGLERIAPRVLSAGAAGGVASRIGPLLHRLGAALASEGVNVQNVISLFHGETAVAIVPARKAGVASPALVIVARTHDEAATRAALAALELPLAQLFPPASSGPGQAPLFNDRVVEGITVHQLAVASGLEIDYAVFDGLVVVSTSVNGITEVASHAHRLVDDAAYRATLGAHPQRLTSLLFLDFSQLLSLGEQTGLTQSARYRALAPDLRRIRAVGLDSTSGEADSTAELLLKIP